MFKEIFEKSELEINNLELKPLTQKEYLEQQMAIILGQENVEKTRSAIGHEPSRNELAQYFVDSGQAEEFSKSHPRKIN